MAGDPRQDTVALAWLKRLAERPHAFGFFTALRRLESHYRAKPRIGYAARPIDEPVRIGQTASLAFAAATLASFQRERDDRYRLQTFFFGLFGPNGALPLHLTEFAYERRHRYNDKTLGAFADLFHHRLATTFYRAWADARPHVQFDRPHEDRFATYVGSLIGIGHGSLRDRDAMPDRAKLHFAGHFAAQTRHAAGLQAILQAFLRVPVRLEQFDGHWLELPEDCHLQLGRDRSCAVLGESAVVGRRTWDRRQTILLRLGPMSLAEYNRLLPGGESLGRLSAVVKNYVGLTLRWNAQLVLRGEEIPSLRLGRQGRLGWTSWLGKRPAGQDAQDLTLRATHHVA